MMEIKVTDKVKSACEATEETVKLINKPVKRPKVLVVRPRTIRGSRRQFKRNDPCPCGSGAKFKGCCG